MISKVIASPRANKRFRVILSDETYYDFGDSNAKTYIDGRSITDRDNYRKRHYLNVLEHRLIKDLIPSPALFAYYLLWGDDRLLTNNIKALNKKLI